MALSGPRLTPKNGPARQLVVICHGYGADGKDLIGLAPQWQKMLPEAEFVAPNAPERCPGAGYQWFPISRIDPRDMRRGVEGAAPKLEAFLGEELARLSLTPDRLALVGFSQGTMMSLHVGLNGTIKPAAIVGFSGMLTTPVAATSPGMPPVLLTHGDSDQVIPPDALFASAVALGFQGISVEWHLRPNLGHGIDAESVAMAGLFLALAFAGRLKASGEASCRLR